MSANGRDPSGPTVLRGLLFETRYSLRVPLSWSEVFAAVVFYEAKEGREVGELWFELWRPPCTRHLHEDCPRWVVLVVGLPIGVFRARGFRFCCPRVLLFLRAQQGARYCFCEVELHYG